ncbi:hypothetical protein [Nostoc commune]|uniref:hypothetical protein n=1 Tax=Nostoc commune TaxID=1178 RepID=UPI001E3EF2C8|nr:hypothetical protein [Nostoc commune]
MCYVNDTKNAFKDSNLPTADSVVLTAAHNLLAADSNQPPYTLAAWTVAVFL